MTLFAYYGHHKAASTWVHGIIEAVCADLGWRSAYLPEPRHFGFDLTRYVAQHRLDFVSYVNAAQEDVATLPPHRAFHLIRDPRDIVVSAYYSHLHSHPTDDFPELIPHRAALEAVSLSEGLLLEIEFSERFLKQLGDWNYEQEHILELKQETFVRDPYNGFLRVFEHLGALDDSHYAKRHWPGYLLRSSLNILARKTGIGPRPRRASIPGERLLGIVYGQRFERLAGNRKRGESDVKSHYRKGRAGDWRSHFEPVHVEAFRARYGDLVERLGYEPW